MDRSFRFSYNLIISARFREAEEFKHGYELVLKEKLRGKLAYI